MCGVEYKGALHQKLKKKIHCMFSIIEKVLITYSIDMLKLLETQMCIHPYEYFLSYPVFTRDFQSKKGLYRNLVNFMHAPQENSITR